MASTATEQEEQAGSLPYPPGMNSASVSWPEFWAAPQNRATQEHTRFYIETQIRQAAQS